MVHKPTLFVCALVGILLPAIVVYHHGYRDVPLTDLLMEAIGSSADLSTPGEDAGEALGDKAAEVASEPEPKAAPDQYMAICLACKNQAPDLPEWLKHHYYNMGFGKFYIMDDGSSPPLSSFVDTYGIPEEALEFHYFNASEHIRQMQNKLYQECGKIAGDKHQWMAFIDADEFFDAPGPETMREVMESFDKVETVGAIGVNWQVHTSNGILNRTQSVLKSYTECIYDDDERENDHTDNKHVKSIVKLKDFVGSGGTPHSMRLKNTAKFVGEYGDLMRHPAFRAPITRDRLSLHHYAVKSRQEYEEKINRGSGMSNKKDWKFWEHIETEMPHVECSQMLRWVQD